MTQVKDVKIREFGDFQTPGALAQNAMAYLRTHDPAFQPATIIEPTCGTGAFLFAAADLYPEAQRIVGLEREAMYLDVVRAKVEQRRDANRFDLHHADFFKTEWQNLLSGLSEPVLITGNPPWVTNADIGRLKGSNLPGKSNFQKYAGLESVMGKANFDISEWMLIQNLNWIAKHKGCLAILCKTAIARKILRYAWNTGVPTTASRMVQIDAMKHFSAAVDACFFVLKTNGNQTSTNCEFFDNFKEIHLRIFWVITKE
ncbi:MAG: hypothetical protein GDA36_07450 [Rhodobacteraceae bacterium]|nr:hypothetical protein [Paracoccaceae bacterium]